MAKSPKLFSDPESEDEVSTGSDEGGTSESEAPEEATAAPATAAPATDHHSESPSGVSAEDVPVQAGIGGAFVATAGGGRRPL